MTRRQVGARHTAHHSARRGTRYVRHERSARAIRALLIGVAMFASMLGLPAQAYDGSVHQFMTFLAAKQFNRCVEGTDIPCPDAPAGALHCQSEYRTRRSKCLCADVQLALLRPE